MYVPCDLFFFMHPPPLHCVDGGQPASGRCSVRSRGRWAMGPTAAHAGRAPARQLLAMPRRRILRGKQCPGCHPNGAPARKIAEVVSLLRRQPGRAVHNLLRLPVFTKASLDALLAWAVMGRASRHRTPVRSSQAVVHPIKGCARKTMRENQKSISMITVNPSVNFAPTAAWQQPIRTRGGRRRRGRCRPA